MDLLFNANVLHVYLLLYNSVIKLIDLRQKITCQNVYGRIPQLIAGMLMSVHTHRRPIFLVSSGDRSLPFVPFVPFAPFIPFKSSRFSASSCLLSFMITDLVNYAGLFFYVLCLCFR